MADPEEILQYWFGELDNPDNKGDFDLWFGHAEETDAEIREKFETDVIAAGAGEYDSWMASPRNCLALIILTDQFTRNIYRGSAKAFSFDEKAREACQVALERDYDNFLPPLARVFLYLPMEHSENIEHQNKSVELFQKLYDETPEDMKETFKMVNFYAVRHREIIERFGRFPHRNEALGRETTQEEAEFLKEPDSSF